LLISLFICGFLWDLDGDDFMLGERKAVKHASVVTCRVSLLLGDEGIKIAMLDISVFRLSVHHFVPSFVRLDKFVTTISHERLEQS